MKCPSDIQLQGSSYMNTEWHLPRLRYSMQVSRLLIIPHFHMQQCLKVNRGEQQCLGMYSSTRIYANIVTIENSVTFMFRYFWSSTGRGIISNLQFMDNMFFNDFFYILGLSNIHQTYTIYNCIHILYISYWIISASSN